MTEKNDCPDDVNRSSKAYWRRAGVDRRRFHEICQGLQNMPVYLTNQSTS